MKITKRQLRRIIREERRRLAEECPGSLPLEMGLEPAAPASPVADVVTESEDPVQALMTEIEVATQTLDQVIESVQTAATLCADCGPVVESQAPILDAVAAGAVALQEMLHAEAEVVAESVGGAAAVEVPVTDTLTVV